jgi:hypothetical protein
VGRWGVVSWDLKKGSFRLVLNFRIHLVDRLGLAAAQAPC